jgi:hypothetical protein
MSITVAMVVLRALPMPALLLLTDSPTKIKACAVTVISQRLTRTQKDSNGSKSSHISPSPGHQQSPNGLARNRQNTGTGVPSNRPSFDKKHKRWIKTPKLVTTRMSNLNIKKEREKSQSDKYFRPVEGETDYPATVS